MMAVSNTVHWLMKPLGLTVQIDYAARPKPSEEWKFMVKIVELGQMVEIRHIAPEITRSEAFVLAFVISREILSQYHVKQQSRRTRTKDKLNSLMRQLQIVSEKVNLELIIQATEEQDRVGVPGLEATYAVDAGTALRRQQNLAAAPDKADVADIFDGRAEAILRSRQHIADLDSGDPIPFAPT